MRKIKFEVVFQETVGFCGEARVTVIKSFDTYPEAETFSLSYNDYRFPIWIQKVFVLEEEVKQ